MKIQIKYLLILYLSCVSNVFYAATQSASSAFTNVIAINLASRFIGGLSGNVQERQARERKAKEIAVFAALKKEKADFERERKEFATQMKKLEKTKQKPKKVQKPKISKKVVSKAKVATKSYVIPKPVYVTTDDDDDDEEDDDDDYESDEDFDE